MLGVPRFQGSLIKHPMLIPWDRRERRNLDLRISSPAETLQLPQSMKCLVTFEEDKFAILSLIGSIDGCRQTPPELANRHWVSIHHLVIPHPPEPSLLETSKGGIALCLVLLQPPKRPHCLQPCAPNFHSSYYYCHPASLPRVLRPPFFSSSSSFYPLTLKTNISPRSMATVSKLPSQMLGP